jgi:hypothetical protein
MQAISYHTNQRRNERAPMARPPARPRSRQDVSKRLSRTRDAAIGIALALVPFAVIPAPIAVFASVLGVAAWIVHCKNRPTRSENAGTGNFLVLTDGTMVRVTQDEDAKAWAKRRRVN